MFGDYTNIAVMGIVQGTSSRINAKQPNNLVEEDMDFSFFRETKSTNRYT